MSRRTVNEFIAVAVLYCIVSIFAMGISLLTTTSPSYDYPDAGQVAKQAFGLSSGKSYPFVYGHQVAGTIGSIDIQSGFFSTTVVSISLSPGSSLDVSFEHGNSSSIIELPLQRINFKQQVGVRPTMRIFVKSGSYDEHTFSHSGLKFNWMIVPYFSSPRQPLSQAAWFKKLQEQNQLGVFLAKYLDGVEVTLPPKLYGQLLHGN